MRIVREQNTIVAQNVSAFRCIVKCFCEWEIISFSKTTLLQRGSFLTMFYTIDSSPLLIAMLTMIESNLVSTAFKVKHCLPLKPWHVSGGNIMQIRTRDSVSRICRLHTRHIPAITALKKKTLDHRIVFAHTKHYILNSNVNKCNSYCSSHEAIWSTDLFLNLYWYNHIL